MVNNYLVRPFWKRLLDMVLGGIVAALGLPPQKDENNYIQASVCFQVS